MKVAFWNVSGLKNKDKGFWGEVEKWDVVMMSETWLDEKNWLTMKSFLPKGYMWRMQEAKKEQAKGRAMGGMVSGVRRELGAEEKKDREGEEKERSMVRRVKIRKEIMAVVFMYRRRGEEEGWNIIKRWTERKGNGLVLIARDLNAWTGVQARTGFGMKKGK